MYPRSLRTAFAALALLSASAATAAGQEKGPPTARVVSAPDVGDRAPEFRLAWATKDSISAIESEFLLKQQLGKTVVLAFYPKDFTSGCTAEMKAFTDRYAELFGPDVVVVGISADSLESHRRFAESLGLPFALLSDPSQRVAEMYGSKGDNGYNRRTVFVIDPRGDVVYRDLRFGALDPKAYEKLQAAVRAARNG
jgi:thioredoxin-dependent peroxiredoxin